MASQQPEVTEGAHPLLASHPSTGENVSDDSPQQISEETSDIQQPVENGFLIKPDGQTSPSASFTYAFSPLTTNAAPMDWKLLVTENVGCQNIRCHELQAGDKLQELITGFQETNAKAVVLINTSDDYFLHPSILAGAKKSSFPVVVLTKSDGMKLLNIVQQHESMLARISVETIMDPPVQTKKAENGSRSAPQEQDMRRPFNLKTQLKKLIYDGEKLQVICEDPTTFAMVMSTFTQHEIYAKSDGSHIDALREINRHLTQTFAQDFPFYLVLAYKIYKKSDIYMCDECDMFMKNCTEKMENLNSQQVASTFLGFLQRGDFGVQFDSNNFTSAFQLLQEACIHMNRFSHDIMQKKVANASKQSEHGIMQKKKTSAAKQSEHNIMQKKKTSAAKQSEHNIMQKKKTSAAKQSEQQLYQRFVYSRFMWVSLYLRLDIKCDAENAENLWNCDVIKAITHLTMKSWMVAEVKKGLDFGQQVELPSNLTFSPLLLAKLFASEGYVRPFSHLSHYISALESYISQESDFFFFVTTMRTEYDFWLKQPGQKNFSAISVQKTLKGSIQEGLSFVDELYKLWTKHSFKSQVFDPECKKWVLLLLELVDVTKDHAEVHLQSFLGKPTLGVVKKYQGDITKHVIEQTCANFSRLSMQSFFPLYKSFHIWPPMFMKDYLHQYKLTLHVRISDPMWQELFSEVVKREELASFTDKTAKFSGAQHHHFLLDFLQSVAKCYHDDGRAGELVVDLLKLKVPKLFAVEGGGMEDETVGREFSAFLRNYINRICLRHTILGKMNIILAAISDRHDEFQQLVLEVVRREVVPEVKDLQGEKAIPSPLYGVLHVAVTTLCRDLSWLQALTTKQRFCWGFIASCCKKIPVAKEQFDWVYSYKYLITHLGYIYNSYCSGKKLPEEKCLHSAEGFPNEIACSPSEDIRSYFGFVRRVQAILLEWRQKFMQKEINYDEIITYASQQQLLEHLAQTVCATSAIVDSQDIEAVKNSLLNAFEQLNALLIKYIRGQPDAKWCSLPSLLQVCGIAFPPHLMNLISRHIVFPGEENKAGELLNNPLTPSTNGIFQPGHDISLKLTKTLTLKELYVLVQGLEAFLEPVMDVLDMLVFFKLHPSEMFDKYLQVYLKKESEPGIEEQNSTTTLSTFSFTVPVFSATSVRPHSADQTAGEGLPLRVLLRAMNHTHELVRKLMQGTATYSEIVAEGELNLEKLDIEREFSALRSFSAYLQLPLSSCEGLTSVQKVLELFQSIYRIPLIHSIREQYQLQACLENPQLFELCQHQVQAILLEWKLKFVEQRINYDEILTYMSQQSQLECLARILCGSSAIVESQVTQAVKNTLMATFEQLNTHLIKYIPGQPDAKWCTLPSLLQDWDVALPSHLLELISQHVVLPGEKKTAELLDNQPSPNTTGVFQPGHDISLKLTKALSLRKLSVLVKELEAFLQPIMDVLDMLVFFKLHHGEMFDRYLQVYLKKESKTVVRGQHNVSSPSVPILSLSSTVPSFPATRMQPKTEEQNEMEGLPLDVLQRAVTHTHEMIMKLIQGTVAYSEIIRKGEMNLENLNIEQEFNILRSFSAYLKLPPASCEGLAGVQSMLELFKYVHYIRTIDIVWEQYQQHGCLKDPQLVELCQRRVQAVLLEWKHKFMQEHTDYDEILNYTRQPTKLENLGQTICASFATEDTLTVKNMFQNALDQLNNHLIKYIPGQPDAKWCTLPSLLQGWGVALPKHLLDVISQHILFPGEEKSGKLLDNQPSLPGEEKAQDKPFSSQPAHEISLKLTKALSLHELSELAKGMKTFLQSKLELMQELLQWTLYIQTIYRVCEEYRLQGCLEDFQLVELWQQVKDLNLEGNHGKVTPLEASKMMERVKKNLCLGSEAYLELFTAVGDSDAFYQFVHEKQFMGEKGRAVFQQQYELITAQLQHEEYNETVLNHLYAAFKIIEPFMDTHQSFQQLMSHVKSLDVTNGVKQLQTVNSNITLIQLWFSRAEGDTLENVAKELNCILTTGYYLLHTTSNVAELMLEYSPSTFHQSTPPPLPSSQPSTLENPKAVSLQVETLQQDSQSRHERETTQMVNVQHWNSEQISDFVRKLGFLDTEKEGGDKIKHFLHINETAHKLLDLSVRLRELGHLQCVVNEGGDKIKLSCYINGEEANRRIHEAEMMLTKWMRQVDELRNQYHWLLFFSVPKMLLLYHLLQEKKPNVEAIVHDISFLCCNDQTAWENAQVVVEKSLENCHKYTESDKAPMHVVGEFLGMVVNNLSLPKRCGEGLFQSCSFSQHSSEPSQLLHYCPRYSQAQLIRLIVSIYNGVPEAFEVFHCHPSSTEEELSLFLKRVAKHPLQYLILKVNRLPFKMQEHLMQLQLVIQEREVEISSKAPCLHLVETAPSILRKMPRVVLREHTESGPILNFEEARKICLLQVAKLEDFTCVQLVYGHAGNGKTHYIKQQLTHTPASLTIGVNEAFTPLKAISKLRTLPLDQKNCAIFFNFTMLPPGGSVHESERVHHQQLMEVIGWFFFDLLMLGYVEDFKTGLSFRIPGGQAWAIYVEVPSLDLSMTPEEALKHFQQEVPALGILGTPHYIDPDTPYTVDEEVQLVCKYLKALQIGGKKGIDRLYREVGFHACQPVKFSSQPNLKKEEYQKLLLQHMPDHVKNTKITQRLFIKYMNRRCGFLDNLPAFNYNTGVGEYITDEKGKRVPTDTKQLGSTLMMTMLREVEDFCDPGIKNNWSLKPHKQLIYDFKDGGFSLGLITLHPDQLLDEDKMKFKKIGVKIPSMIELHSRKLLDEYLSRALSVELEDKRLTAIDDSDYVLTLDYTIKMLNIHERYHCSVPVIIEGETGVGKTALLEMLSKLWNQSLLLEWKRQRGRLLDFIREKLGTVTTDLPENYQTCLEAVEALSAGKHVSEKDLVLLGQLPDAIQGHRHLYTLIRSFLLPMKSDPVVTLLKLQEPEQQQASLEQLFERAETEDSAESTASLLYGVLTAQMKPTFHKLNVHAAMTPADVWDQLEPVFSQAKLLQEAFKNKVADTFSLGVPFVTVFLDEVNTSSCLGLFKEIIVDRTFDGEPIPENVFIVAACNPNRGNSLALHSQNETWIQAAYYVRQLHPTLRFLMWDYGSLDKHQEKYYINAKMDMFNKQMPNAEVASLTELIMTSQDLMRKYAFGQLTADGLDKDQAKIYSRSCVSQRDIQRVFTFYQWLVDSYARYRPYGERQDYSRRAVLVALGIVYYMRLDNQYRKEYEEYLDKQIRLQNEVSFSQAFSDELDWYINQIELPTGISKTRALKENLFAIIVCTVTCTPLIIVGAPGSSKTLSFNLAIDNLKGQESKVRHFRDTKVFRSLDPHFYQCSRRTTSNEIQTVFSRAINRQRSHSKFKLPIYCVVCMDEAGLPEESHESLKVLHYYLDQQEVSFVAISNHVLDAAKTNRAVSLFRPEASEEDLETLAKGCLCNTPDEPPPKLKKDLETIVQFCPAFSHLMKKTDFRQYFGLRDFIHFVSYLRRHQNEMLTQQVVMEALERNFNGSDNFDKICNTFLKMVQSSTNHVHCHGILEVLKNSLEDLPQKQGQDMAEAEVRYKLIIDPSEDDSLVRLLFFFGVLQREKTRIFMCSDFPGDSQLQKVNTIAAIRHSVIEGHTVVMTQTDDIHESFYDLFNQRFRKIDDPQEGTRYYTNIAIGAHLKPSRVDPNFQCVVVVKKSEVENTPAPFLNRFEKYCITHHSLLEVALAHLPPCIRIIVEAAMRKVQVFIDCISGPSSLYGLKVETLDSLVLSLLPSLTHTYESLREPSALDSKLKPFKEPSVMKEPPKEPSMMEEPPKEPSMMEEPPKDPSMMEEPPKEPSMMEEPPKQPSMMEEPPKEPSMMEEPPKQPSMMEEPLKEPSMVDGTLDLKVLLMKELLQNLCHCAGFNIPPYFLDELHWDADSLFDLVLCDQQFEDLLPSLSHSSAVQAVAEAMRVLHSAPAPQDGAAQLSTEGCLVVTLLQQWLVRYLCKRLMQLMTSEAFILYRNTLPSSYLENYISFQAHFSLKELILKYHQALIQNHSEWNPACSPTKLLCFTRSSSLVHQLPAQYPSPVLDALAASIFQHTLCDLVFPDPSKLVVCTLSSLLSQSSMQEMLKMFVLSDKAQVCLLVVNMQETSRQVVNHLRIMIEEAELLSTQRAKLFVILLHFPPTQFFNHCYPSLFLKGWDHCYLDTVAHSAGKGVIDIQDWLYRCCFPKEDPGNRSLVLALKDILPEAIPVLYSRVFFGSNKQGSFNKPMNGSQRTKALKELLFKKGVGQILCEMYCSYWKPAVMTKYLERAAMFTKDNESTLNITDSIQIVFKDLFFDFLAYMLSQINDGCNIDVLFNSDCKESDSEDSESKESDSTLAVQGLFLDIVQTFSLPKLSQLQFLSTSLPATTSDHSPKFPFFKMVYEAVERIVKQSHDKINAPPDLFQEEETESMDSFHIRDYNDVCNVFQEVKKRIEDKMETTPKENLVLAVEAMELHPELWQHYFDDFLQHKLQLECLHSGGVSQQVLHKLFQQLHKQEAISRVVCLHCYTHIHYVDLVKMANLLRPLNQIQQTTTIEFHLPAPTPEGEDLAKATQTQNLLGTPEHVATFVVNALFAAIVEANNVSVTTVPEKMKVWFKAYRDSMTLPAVKKIVYGPLGSEVGGQRKVVEAKLNLMQAVFLAIQTSPSLEAEILQKGLYIFQTLLNKHFTKTLELIGCCPNLEEMASVTLKIISESTTFSRRSVQLLVEGLFAHFFSPYRHSYHTEDIHWFLELANKQEKWRADPLEHSQHQQPVTRTETSTTFQILQGATSMCVFKQYLGRILGPHDQCVDKVATLSAPLLLHFEQPRSQVGMVLMAAANLGSPAPYIPTFYQQCSSITPSANHENSRMQQPLAHLYFLTLLEHLQAQGHKLSGLVRTANAILQQCASAATKEVESVVLWIELQAVVQVILQKLAVHLNPSKLQMEEVHPLVDDINRLLDDVETGGGDTNGHGMVLVMHLMKRLKSSQKLTELLTRKYDSICSWLHCLKPFHEQFTSRLEPKPQESMPHYLPFMQPGAESTELGKLYLRVRKVMVDVHDRRAKMKNLIDIAEECAQSLQSLQVKDGSSTHLSTESNLRASAVDKKHCFRMMVWFCAYYDFYDKKITSKLLCSAVESKLAPYLQEKGCIRLIQCFLNPKLMLCHSKTPNPLQEDNHCTLEREGKINPLHQLFMQGEHKQIGQSDTDLRHSLANLVGVVLGCPSYSNHLWYHLFSPRELSGTYMTGFMYNAKIDPDDLLYDCGVELSSEGLFGHQDYVKHATRGTYTLHSLYLLLWANFGAFCMALLTQPEAETAIHGSIISKKLSLQQYCVSKLRTLWKHMRKNLGLSDEERSFLAMCCTKKLYEIFKSKTTAPDCLQGVFQTCQELDSYEKMWHTHIYHPAWSELKKKHSRLWLNKLFTDVRSLGLCYPHFPTEQDFIHSVLSTGDICSYTQKGKLYLLGQFAQEWPRLQAGGLLLPDLVEFYQWLHTALAHQVKKEHARTLSIGCVLKLAVQRYSKEEGQHLQALYNRVKDGYNQYVRLSGGTTSTGPCSALRQGKKIYTISDDTPLLHFLSDEADKEESNDRLSIVAADIIAAHNTFIEAVYSAVRAKQLSLFLPDEPQRVYPSEVNDSRCIVGKLRSVCGINDFLQLIRSRYQPTSDASMEVQVPEFSLSLLQEDIVAYFLAGKPLIYIEPSSPLRIPFKFHQSTNSVEEADVVVPALDENNFTEKLPDTFKAPLEESLLKQLEYEFHSASYHTMVEVVNGLRIVAGHLVKAVMERNCEGLEQKTVPQFMLMLYGHDKESSAVLKEIGVCSTSHSQLVCLLKLPLSSLLYCLQLFTSWVRDGVYDFAALPLGLKNHLCSQDLQSIEQIPLKWTGIPGDLLTEIKQMNDVLKHSEARIAKTANESANKPLMQYLQEIHHLRIEDRLPSYMPPSILIQHYVYFRIALRRLALRVQQQVKAEADNGDTEKEQWREGVNDLWKNKLSHLREEIIGPFVYDPQTGRYGFQEGLEYDSEEELMDNLMNEVEGENHAPKGNGEDPDHHVTSVGSHSLSYNQEFYNNGAFVYDPHTGRYGFQEGLDYDSEEELMDDLVNKEDCLPKGDAEESFVVISEGQVPSVEFNRREKEEGTGGPKESDEGLAQIYKDPEFRKKIRSMAREYRDTQTLEQSAQDCTPEHVGQFLEEIGLGHHVAKFTEQDISGDMLLDPDQEMLEELGVTSAIERLRIKVLFQRSLQGGEVQYPLESVLNFLEQNKLDKYRDIFQKKGMDGDLLLEADDNVLKELGVSSAVDRKKLKTKYKTFVKSQL